MYIIFCHPNIMTNLIAHDKIKVNFFLYWKTK